MTDNDDMKLDKAFSQLLRYASETPVPPGAQSHLMARIRATPQLGYTQELQPRMKLPYFRPALGLPLAASLLLGIYLGTQDSFDNIWSDTITGLVLADPPEPGVTNGFEDIEQYADGELT